MSLALIEESAKEVRRLAIAGSPLAVGDFRLKKFIAPLAAAGEKVPVFAQVAKSIGEVVNGQEADSAANLLNLSTLLNAILYTQGQSGAPGDVRELETFPTTCTSTRTPARVLKPLVEALTSTGGGRFEVIKSACERGAFNDLRLIDPAIRALGDNYPELADLVAEKILPAYGPGILLRIKATFDLKGKREHARRLQLMHQLDPAGTLELCKTALENGSPEVKAAAIACLGQHEDCLPLVLEQAKAKNKTLRAAALEALAVHDRPEVTKLFTELIQGNTLDILAGPFRSLRNQPVLNALLEEGKRVFGLVIAGDSEQLSRCWEIFDCLAYRKDPEVEEFLLHCLSKSEALSKVKIGKNLMVTAARSSIVAGEDLTERLVVMLYQIGTPKALEAILAKRESLPTGAFPQVWRSALRTWPPAKVFDEFSPLVGQKKGPGRQKFDELNRFMAATQWEQGWRFAPAVAADLQAQHRDEVQLMKQAAWDGRWLDAAIKAGESVMVYSLARPDHPAALKYLLGQSAADKPLEPHLIISALLRCRYPQVTDVLLKLIAKKTGAAKYFDYELQLLLGHVQHLPAADLPKLDAFAAKLDEKFVDKYLEALAPLRVTTPTN
ncbi:MAG: HEAT repeat domain-containing protein [Verrucomicrobiae bacterium]|nr:HEAT repeat domain-containing protein [Verrucomicrobiae bacterium]